MKILLTSHGSTGDLYPVIGLGRALREAGHTVNFASAPLYREEIERAGLGFRHLPPDWKQEIFVEAMRELDRQKHPILLLRQIFRSGLSFMKDLIDELANHLEEHDILVGSYLFPQYKSLCDRVGKPFAVVNFCHSVVPREDLPPEGIFSLRGLPRGWQKAWNRLWWAVADRVICRVVNSVVQGVLKEKNLPPLDSYLRRPADLCLVAVSPGLMKPPSVAERFVFTGYLRWQSAPDEALEQKVQAFTQGEKVPVLTFGSVAFDHIPEVMGRFSARWPVGRKIIVQSGWAGLSVDLSRQDILVVGKVSHDQLFRHASVVIHHGGAGTTASVLHAGVPQVVIPHFGDQYFWAETVRGLGVGRILRKRYWPERLGTRVQSVEKASAYAEKARAAAALLAQEDGPGKAVRALENFVQKSRVTGS